MENKLLRFGTALALVAMLTLGCKKSDQIWEATPPFPGLEKPLSSYLINTNRDTVLSIPGGTSLFIKAGTFVTLDGQNVDGEIELLYREFHDAVDIMLAGIHMDFYSMGERRTFQTAGMFEIDAKKDEKQLKIADDKNINVRFGSQYQGNDYSFFYLNPNEGNWEWVDMPGYEINGEKVDAQVILDAKSPKLYMGKEYFIFNYDRFLDIYLKDNWPEILKYRNDLRFKKRLEEYNVGFNNYKVDGEVQFMRGFYHPAELLWKDLDRKRFPKWLDDFKIRWERVNDNWQLANLKFQSKGNNKYEITFMDEKRVFSKQVEAVLPLKNLFRLQPQEWQKQYDDAMVEVAAEQSKIDLMAETYRSFSVSQLGIYNFDKLLNEDEWFRVNPSFIISDSKATGRVFIIFGDNSGYIAFTPEQFSTIKINPESKHRIIQIGENAIGYYPVENFSEWDTDDLRKQNIPSITFDLVSFEITDAISLREFLGF